ncbi:PREDICTED: serine/threonine-protein kinase haspin homolog [Camelina sativa]|uniref:non-specific serine/threonine protein kinase n=1 Tax=Camelina sativa TaxID=90675 RepID=A0ABM1QW35_CAMSA|nr:PREDICTED: serine/threonine-protein kinase haspin homolog [Camelina sativa]
MGERVDLWSEVIKSEEEEGGDVPKIEAVYQRRKKPENKSSSEAVNLGWLVKGTRTSSINGLKRDSWARSLSTRGRESIAVRAYANNQPQKKPARRKKPPIPKGKVEKAPDFQKEKEYFRDIDAFELLEESPSPNKPSTWTMGEQVVPEMPHLSTRLEKWLISKKFNHACGPSSTLSKIFENSISTHLDFDKSFLDLLSACGQMQPSNFMEALSKFCEPDSIVKIGEGTYGEAFRTGSSVCKIVPIDGDFRVNGEVQKRADELHEEVILSWTLNQLREFETEAQNSCPAFIKTQDIKVCQGPYDPILIKAWEEWDDLHGSENDHPDFPEKQCYVMFVLEHGGKDLESFVLLNFDEARSLLVQVTAGLAVAEAAFEFEHRDLHWGNILLSRNNSCTLPFILEGKQISIKTFGVQISIIDFTLSRINTGEKILFLDLTSDPYLFKGPKGDKQAETYRKMKAVTEDYWEGSFARTNVLWLIYLVDILLTKKSFERSSKKRKRTTVTKEADGEV